MNFKILNLVSKTVVNIWSGWGFFQLKYLFFFIFKYILYDHQNRDKLQKQIINTEKKVFSDEKKRKPSYIVLIYPHFLSVWIKFETFYFQIYCLKKRGNWLIKGKLSFL
jgi:hypothetical protein